MFREAWLSKYHCTAYLPFMTKVNGLHVFADSIFLLTFSVYWKQIFNSENYFLSLGTPPILNV